MESWPLICLLAKSRYYQPKTNAQITLYRARPNFYMLSNNPYVTLKVVDCSMFTRTILVAGSNHQYFWKFYHSILSKLACSEKYFH